MFYVLITVSGTGSILWNDLKSNEKEIGYFHDIYAPVATAEIYHQVDIL